MRKSFLPTVAFAVVLLATGASVAGCTSVGPASKASSSAGSVASAPASSGAGSSSGGAGSASGTDAAGQQTKGQACTVLATSMQDLSTKMSSSYATYASNPKAAVAAIQELSDTFDANVAKVTDPGALDVATKANSDLKTFVADTKAAIAHPAAGAAKVQKDATLIQADFAKIGAYCG